MIVENKEIYKCFALSDRAEKRDWFLLRRYADVEVVRLACGGVEVPRVAVFILHY
jgi:hypothetical protein